MIGELICTFLDLYILQIYVKIKWKNASGYQEEHKSPEVSASNAVFAPPFCLDIDSIDSAAKVSFAVKGDCNSITIF